jgi:hypothetical protein
MALLGVGYRVGAQVSGNDDRIQRLEDANRGLDFRLCRIERALNIAPYQSCYEVRNEPRVRL